MDAFIARSDESSPRFFPPISSVLYTTTEPPTSLTPAQQAARALLALANTPLTRWQRFLGWRLDIPGRLGRLLLHHRMAMTAEMEGQWQRADFFWHLAYSDFKALADQPAVWETLATMQPAAAMEMGEAAHLRQRLVDEIFIETHCALYNGLIQNAAAVGWDHRAFVHIDYIKELLPWSSLAGEALHRVLGPPEARRIALCREAEQWQQAMHVCTDLQRRFPEVEDYQDKLAELHFWSTLSTLENGTTEASSRADAVVLQGGIHALERMQQSYPYKLTLFEMLGHLYHRRAVKLANSQHLADALVAAQKALTYDPALEEAQATRSKLVEMMQELQTHMQEVMAELAQRPDATLNEQGRRMRDDAQQGFGPINAYLESSEPERISTALSNARARRVWQRIGLSIPMECWDEQAHALLEGLATVFEHPPVDRAGVAPAWTAAVTSQADLAELDPVPICAFLERRLFDDEAEAAVEPTFFAPTAPPVLTVVPTERQLRGEPWPYWLWSGQDLRLKFQAVAALVAVLVVGGLTVRDVLARHTRDAAYHRLITAAQQQDARGLIEGAEAFLSHPSLSRNDGRNHEVVKLYNEAFVHWFVGLEGELDTMAQARIERYRTLVK